MVKEDCSASLIMKLRLEGVVVTHVEHVAEQSSRGKSKLVKQEYSQDVRGTERRLGWPEGHGHMSPSRVL